jgi:hypothetical protein
MPGAGSSLEPQLEGEQGIPEHIVGNGVAGPSTSTEQRSTTPGLRLVQIHFQILHILIRSDA